MPHTPTNEDQAIVLFGTDGTKYIIPTKDLDRYEVGQVTEIPKLEASEDIQPIVGAQVASGLAEFYIFGAT